MSDLCREPSLSVAACRGDNAQLCGVAQLQILPPQVRAQFSCVLLRIGGYDLELADLLLSSAANQMQTQLQVAEIWGRNHYRACHDYLAFAHAQQLQAQAGRHRSRIRTAIAPNAPVAPSEVVTPIFPEWEAIPDNTLMGVPSAKALEESWMAGAGPESSTVAPRDLGGPILSLRSSPRPPPDF